MQQENANTQVQELETENRRLCDCAQHPSSEGEDPASAQQLQELYEQVLRDLQDRRRSWRHPLGELRNWVVSMRRTGYSMMPPSRRWQSWKKRTDVWPSRRRICTGGVSARS